jgi:hypothetical protein
MNKNGTGGVLWPLKSASGENPALTAGSPSHSNATTCPTGRPPGRSRSTSAFVLLTLAGTLTQSGSTGTAIPRDRLPGLLISSIDWTNSFFGTVLSPRTTRPERGCRSSSSCAGGYQYGQRQSNQILAANGTYAFSMTLAIPALNDRRGRLFKDTSNMALFSSRRTSR